MRNVASWRFILIIIGAWFVAIFLLVGTNLNINNGQNSEEFDQLNKRLHDAGEHIKSLQEQNKQLSHLIGQLKHSNGDVRVERAVKPARGADQPDDGDAQLAGPTDAYSGARAEDARRLVKNSIVEQWYYVRAQIDEFRAQLNDAHLKQRLDRVFDRVSSHTRVALYYVDELENATNVNGWRDKEMRELTMLIQKRLHYLQNPKSCKEAKRLLCDVNKGCGFGCQIHHVAYCLQLAYASGRTMVLTSNSWRYSSAGWESVFKPLSSTCNSVDGEAPTLWGDGTFENARVVSLPIIDSLRPQPQFLPLAVPRDLAPRLKRLHGNPFVFWMGQLMHFLWRFQPTVADYVDQLGQQLAFKQPIVGVHVRRTDKVGTEASFHALSEYMFWVDEYFKQLSLRQKVDKKRIYLATDDPSVLDEAKKNFKDYEVLGDLSIAQSAQLASRYNDVSLKGVIIDIEFLSRCDYLVCTFSSQVCRVAYELMQLRYSDAHDRFHSLDDIYYFGGQLAHDWKAVFDSQPDYGEIPLQKGDLIGIAGNHWDGQSKGLNKETGRQGLFPSYLTVDVVRTVEMPTYPEADSVVLPAESRV